MSEYIDDAREQLNEWASTIDAETFSKQYEVLSHNEGSVTKNIDVTLSVSIKTIRAPIELYEEMLLSDDPVLSKSKGKLYLGKFLIVADESLDEIDIDFECNMVDNDE